MLSGLQPLKYRHIEPALTVVHIPAGIRRIGNRLKNAGLGIACTLIRQLKQLYMKNLSVRETTQSYSETLRRLGLQTNRHGTLVDHPPAF